MIDKLAFGSNLKQLRKKKGLSRAQLAQEISYSEKAVEKWEMGGSVPPVATVCKLASFFQISVDALLYNDCTPNCDEERAEALLEQHNWSIRAVVDSQK